MKTFRFAMLGLGVAVLCLGGCAERPGQKKDDKKGDDAKGDDAKGDDAKGDDKKADAKD